MNPVLIPPTPTMLPPAPVAPVAIAENAYRVWRYTDEAVMVWQQIGPSRTQVIQVAILLIIVIASVYLVARWANALMGEFKARGQ